MGEKRKKGDRKIEGRKKWKKETRVKKTGKK